MDAEQKEEIDIKLTVDSAAECEPVNSVSPTAVAPSDNVLKDAPDFGERFQVLECVGEGGMGVVYKAFDVSLNKVFAIKLLRSVLTSDKQALKRFEKEAQAAINLNHPGLVAVYEHNALADGTPFLVMDFVEGKNLADVIETEKRLDPLRAVSIAHQIAEALEHVHEAGLLHRDVKSRNIILTTGDNGEDVAKLVDFGIVKTSAQSDATTPGVTQTGDFMGSPLYMSPEQCQGEELGATSDLYSAGCVMYEMLTGKTPFASPNPVKIVVGHLSEKPKSMSSQIEEKSDLVSELEMMVSRCLEKHPSKRYQSAVELKHDLSELLAHKNPLQQRKKEHSKTFKGSMMVMVASIALVFLAMLSPTVYGPLWSVYDALQPHVVPLFAGSVVLFLLMNLFTARLRSRGGTPQKNPGLMVLWVVSYFLLMYFFMMLPRVPIACFGLYTFFLLASAGSAGNFFLRYAAIPKENFLAPLMISPEKIPSAQQNEALSLWRKLLLSLGVVVCLLLKTPEYLGVSQFAAVLIGIAIVYFMVSVCGKVHKRLRAPETTKPGDRWLYLSGVCGALGSLGYTLHGVIELLHRINVIPESLATIVGPLTLLSIFTPFVIALVFCSVWAKRRDSISLGKSDGW